MTRTPPPDLLAQTLTWATTRYGTGSEVTDLRTMPGHAGLTYGFDVRTASGDDVASLILRLPPTGVKRQGNTDVLRQVPLLEALAADGQPVATVVDSSDDETIFGVPYLIVARMPGRNVSIDHGGEEPHEEHYRAAAEALGRLHTLPAKTALADWDTARTYRDEVLVWDRALAKCAEQSWHVDANALRDALLDAAPDDAAIGLVHGDYQFSNLLFAGEELTAILDWEISSIGPPLADLGWLLVINDQASWSHPIHVSHRPDDAVLVEAYARGRQEEVPEREVAYAKALAAYRFAIIAGLNLHLHRTGRRVDAHWELLEPSIPVLIERGQQDLASAR